MLILLPDAQVFVADHLQAWAVYGALWQVRDLGLCLVAIWAPKTYATRVVLLASASWYAGQAIDEYWFGNTFKEGVWEYPALAILAILTAIFIWHHDNRKDHQAKLDH